MHPTPATIDIILVLIHRPANPLFTARERVPRHRPPWAPSLALGSSGSCDVALPAAAQATRRQGPVGDNEVDGRQDVVVRRPQDLQRQAKAKGNGSRAGREGEGARGAGGAGEALQAAAAVAVVDEGRAGGTRAPWGRLNRGLGRGGGQAACGVDEDI
ncbi:hypothetical protein GALMADRAFT_144641 [Galerina marginata CBS 339.88]|uniref:Uncharacterized protein n=1 Tax=Galerina marginata (strain CBS 339.88) TaxID=685588 RepID=A0A067SU75_GALM3|nr:hypothetical protein GALMADRAFT_144641 [Galerina marginata CBS 339.88]